jgi:hypothetical protein
MRRKKFSTVIYPIVLLVFMLVASGVYAENRDKKDDNQKQNNNYKEQKASPPQQHTPAAPAQKHEAPRVQQERKVETPKSIQRDNASGRSAVEQRKTEQVHKQQPNSSSPSPKWVPSEATQKHEKTVDQYKSGVKEKHDSRSVSGLPEKQGKHPDIKREEKKSAPAHIVKDNNRDLKHDRHTRVLNGNERKEIHQKVNHHPSNHERIEARSIVTEERARFRHTYSSRFVPSHYHRTVLKRVRIVPTTYYYRRHVYYDYYGYVPPAYVYGWYPYYGIWDGVFLGLVLERSFDPYFSAFYYHHMYDEDIIRWRQEAERQATENAELRAKLNQLDQEAARLNGTPRDDSYIPPDAEDLAISPDIIDRLN